jgi:hypothetical protein
VPEEVRSSLVFTLVERVQQVFDVALVDGKEELDGTHIGS